MDTDRYCNGMWVRWNGRVTHWMPLPFGLEDPEQEASPWIPVKERLPDGLKAGVDIKYWMPLPNLPGHGVVKKTEGSYEA